MRHWYNENWTGLIVEEKGKIIVNFPTKDSWRKNQHMILSRKALNL